MHHQSRWTIEKLGRRLDLLETLVYRQRLQLAPLRYEETDPQRVPELDSEGGEEIPFHTHWGVGGKHFVLRGTFELPEDWRRDSLALFLPIGQAGDFSHPECLVYLDGTAYGACDRHHQEVLLPEDLKPGQHRLALQGWTGTGLDQDSHRPLPYPRLLMRPCELVRIDEPTRRFVARARVALGIALAIEEHSPTYGRLLNCLDEAFQKLDLREPHGDAFYASVPEAYGVLSEGIRKAGPPLDVTMVATGHAHIDVAWLWTLDETRRKAARTFHNVLALMKRHPEFHFTQSQPQLYDYVRQDHPEVFGQVQELVKQGRWEVIGGMWVEADGNVSGGEALVRQFLLGRAFFAQHFGPEAETPVLWLPDVFGYPASLPQLIKGAGLEYFFTIKIGWSQYNKVPYDSFWWQGLDGTRVLTHFSTSPDLAGVHASTYNAEASPKQVLGTWRTLRNKEKQSQVLMAFGQGDGGGGPTREMLENLEEMREFPSCPRARQGSVKKFFQDLEAEAGAGLPVWDGELYLELHRGTYTSQARSKRANRKSEVLLHEAEFLATLAGGEYPHERLRRAWELLCLHQFHDILPGSSIGQVYVDSMQDYAEIEQIGEAIVAEALGRPEQALVVNSTSFAREEVARWEEAWVAVSVPPYSVLPLTEARKEVLDTGLSCSEGHLENKFVRVELNSDGELTRVFDKRHGREVLPAGQRGNQLWAFEDRPLNYEAWDVDSFFEDRSWQPEPGTLRVVESGPLRATLEVERKLGSSRILQRISLAYNSARLDFETEVDWRERRVMLKAAFPVTILNPQASHDIQWGHIQRPTHRNTSWDWAQFETCAHKWIDLSEDDFGVSLLNDCKYGHDVRANVMRITLLRSPTAPDPEADQGEQRFTYALLPHGAGLQETVEAGYALNHPLRLAMGGSGHRQLFACDLESVVIETVKRAEDDRGIVVRLYQSQRRRGKARLSCSLPVQKAWRCNMLEVDEQPLELHEGGVSLDLGPFEIATIRFLPSGP